MITLPVKPRALTVSDLSSEPRRLVRGVWRPVGKNQRAGMFRAPAKRGE